MLKVFLTVDTEIWPSSPGLKVCARDLDRDIYGSTPQGQYGLPFQMNVLDAYELKAVFFVESLCACALGLDPLGEVINLIRDGGHDIQLHIHTEWLEKMERPILASRTGMNIKDFDVDDQSELIARGLDNLRACGLEDIHAFRAGNFGANFDTLRALARNGLTYDTSHNTCRLGRGCDLDTGNFLVQPRRIHDLIEFPVSFFEDWPGHYRHTQLTACSARELKKALMAAWRQGWYSFVILWHGNELLKKQPNNTRNPPMPDRIVISRFEKLCRFLANNRDKFETATFKDLNPDMIPMVNATRPLKSNVLLTAWRYSEQLTRRWF